MSNWNNVLNTELKTHIIVGGGPGGIILASKLIETCNVILIERGTSFISNNEKEIISNPIRWTEAAYYESNKDSLTSSIKYKIVPQKNLYNRENIYPQGCGLGGSLNINACMFTTGHQQVFDKLWPNDWNSNFIDRLSSELSNRCNVTATKSCGDIAIILNSIRDSLVIEENANKESNYNSFWGNNGSTMCTEYWTTTTQHKTRLCATNIIGSGKGKLLIIENTKAISVIFETVNNVRIASGITVQCVRTNKCGVIELSNFNNNEKRGEIILCCGVIETPLILCRSGLAYSLNENNESIKIEIIVNSIINNSHLDEPSEIIEDKGSQISISFSKGLAYGIIKHVKLTTNTTRSEENKEYNNNHLLRGVGSNLQDHILLPLFYINWTQAVNIIVNFFILLYNICIVLPLRYCTGNCCIKDMQYRVIDDLSMCVNGVHGWIYLTEDGHVYDNANSDIIPSVQLLFVDGRILSSLAEHLAIPNISGNIFWSKSCRLISSIIKFICTLRIIDYILSHCVVSVLICLVQPKSRGHISYKHIYTSDNSYLESVVIDPKYLEDCADRKLLHRAMMAIRKVVDNASNVNKSYPYLIECLPGLIFNYCKSETSFYVYSSLYATSYFHMCGTCKMKLDSEDSAGVVDSNLCVRGIEGLRIADASVIPNIATSPIAAVVMSIGLKAAEFLK